MFVFVNRRRFLVALALLLPNVASAAPSVVFLDGNAARAAIVNDARDPYFARLQPLDMAAKTGSELTGTPEQQRAETHRRYQAAVRPFRPEEQQAIRAYIEALAPMLRDYPRFARQAWRFVKVADHIEGGLPHTRDDTIVLSEQVGRELFTMRRQLPEDAALLRAGMLLVHEQVHVLQRHEPRRFEALYTRSFGFRRVPPLALTAELVANEVINPDGLSCCWLYPRAGGDYLLPFLAYAERRGLRRLPEDFRMLAVSVQPDGAGYRIVRDADGRARTEELERVTEFVEAFPLTRNYYHPNETAADLFAQLVLFDGQAGARMPAAQREALEAAFAPLRSAFRAAFAR
jgi:hypothetical protein